MKNFKLKNISLVIMMAVSVLSLTACNDKKKDDGVIDIDATVSSTKKVETPVAPVPVASTPVVATTENKDEVKIYKESLKNSYSDSKKLSIKAFNDKDYQYAIEFLTEGITTKTVHDNFYCTVAIGWNYGFRNKNEVQKTLESANVSQENIDLIKAVSNRKEDCIVPSVNIPVEQGISIGKYDTKTNFEPGIIRILGKDTWDKLSDNEKAVFDYFPQKMGLGSALHFKKLIASVQEYSNNKNDTTKQKVVDNLVIHYKIKDKNGQLLTKEDTRSHLLMGAMFTSPQAFAAILGLDGADKVAFTKVAQSINVTIDSSKSIEDQVNEHDDLNKAISENPDAKVEMLDEDNKSINLIGSFETGPNQLGASAETINRIQNEAAVMTGVKAPSTTSNVTKPVQAPVVPKEQKAKTHTPVTSIPVQEPQVPQQPKNRVCNKTVTIQGQQVTVPVPCEQ